MRNQQKDGVAIMMNSAERMAYITEYISAYEAKIALANKNGLFDSATLMLHSKDLGIRLPQSEEFSFFTSDTPVRFKKVMHKLHKMYQKNSR